jgi:glucosamine--fructose-6-phosphate aminotransferase (isomerizing)
MCGIFAIVEGDNAQKKALAGIKQLDYRGYDSWGLAVVSNETIELQKMVGLVPDSIQMSTGRAALAHTRWATHGGVTRANAHPHLSSDGTFALAHNGIVENDQKLREVLTSEGTTFDSQTDSEVIVKWMEKFMKKGDNWRQAFEKIAGLIEGRNAIAVLHVSGELMAFRQGSPLVMGKNGNTWFLASDVSSLTVEALQYRMIHDGEIVYFGHRSLKVMKANKKNIKAVEWEKIDKNDEKQALGMFEDFMIKEIWETPQAITNLVQKSMLDTQNLARDIKRFNQVFVIGAGTAGVAAKLIAFYLREKAQVHAMGFLAAEVESYLWMMNEDALLITPSQSGETADVLQIIEKVKKRGVKIASLVNMPGSMMTNLSDYKIMAHAGREASVMSTKVFTTQVVWGLMLAMLIDNSTVKVAKKLKELSELVKNQLNDKRMLKNLDMVSERLIRENRLLLMGVNAGLLVMEEGMIKITEGSYIQAQAVAAGNLKHFAITLIESKTPVLVNMLGNNSEQIISSVKEIQARGAEVWAIDTNNHKEYAGTIKVPDHELAPEIMAIVPLQLLARDMAKRLRRNIDKPRNIAKSVTVL